MIHTARINAAGSSGTIKLMPERLRQNGERNYDKSK